MIFLSKLNSLIWVVEWFFSLTYSLRRNKKRHIYKSCWCMGQGDRIVFNQSRLHQDACWKQSWQGNSRIYHWFIWFFFFSTERIMHITGHELSQSWCVTAKVLIACHWLLYCIFIIMCHSERFICLHFQESSRAVTKKEGVDFARQYGCLFVECSARTRVNVEKCFEELVLKVCTMQMLQYLYQDRNLLILTFIFWWVQLP